MAAYRRVFGSSYLRADCLYTGISYEPNARQRVWGNFTFFIAIIATANIPRILRFLPRTDRVFIQFQSQKIYSLNDEDEQ